MRLLEIEEIDLEIPIKQLLNFKKQVLSQSCPQPTAL